MEKQRINSNGYVMIVYDIDGEGEKLRIYQCAKCNAFFSSYTGAEFHDCSKVSLGSTPTEVCDKFLDFVCCNNISERAATGSYLRNFLTALHTDFVLPYRGELAEMIIDYAERIQQKMLLSLKGEIVSILIDGATRVFKKFEGVILYTHNALHFFAVLPVSNEKSTTITDIVGRIVRILVSHNIEVAAVCADNARVCLHLC